MAGRKRASSEISGDESETIETVQCHREMDALKPFEEGLDSECYPCIVLEDATVFEKDGRTVANLLNVELGGPYIVRGRLVVDKDVSDCLQHKNYQGQYIEISDCQGFSIGIDPIVLWALGGSGWLEIRPSRKYTKTYEKMSEGINMFFFLTVLYETRKEKYKKSLNVEQIFLQYGKNDGTGLLKSEVFQRFEDHTEFLLSQMGRVESSMNWKSTSIFNWLKSVKPDIHQKLELQRLDGNSEQKKQAVTSHTPGFVDVNKIHVSDTTQIQVAQTVIKPAIRKNRFGPSSVQSKESQDNAGIGSLVAPEDTSTVGLILRIFEKRHQDIHKVTLSKLGVDLYYQYSISKYKVAHALLNVYANDILAALSDDWTHSKVYEELKTHVETNQVGEFDEEALNMILRPRNRKSKSEAQSGTESVQPPRSTGKTVPRSYTGQRSGKGAVLRLASTVKRSSTEDSSEEEQHNTTQQRKRQRQSPNFRTGSPESDEQNLKDDEDDDDDLDDDQESNPKTEISLKIVSELLPTMDPTGPNDMWACHKEGCTFIVRNALDEDGRKQIRQHFLEHADIIARETLVLEEARPHLPVSHLLEKLRGLGEIAGINEKRDTQSVNDVSVPRPIKRHGMVM